MKEIKKSNNENILKREIRMFFSQEFMHKGQLIAWIFADVIKIFGLCFVWIASSKITGNADPSYIVCYYLLVMLIGRFMSDITPENGIRNILSGRFSNYLLKPVSYLLSYLGDDVGANLFRLLVSVPTFVVGYLIASHFGLWTLSSNPYLLFLCFCAVVLGFLINFFMGNIFTLMAFYNKNMDGMRTFYYNISSFLSGEYAPLIAFPLPVLFFIQLLPFRYTLSFPIEILLGRMTTYDITYGFTIGIVWLIILIVIYSIFYSHSIKKYAGEGI
jgi:ABC-2 type transport system permease protein